LSNPSVKTPVACLTVIRGRTGDADGSVGDLIAILGPCARFALASRLLAGHKSTRSRKGGKTVSVIPPRGCHRLKRHCQRLSAPPIRTAFAGGFWYAPRRSRARDHPPPLPILTVGATETT